MSEYQYYEFQAIDSLLTDKDRQALRALSSRARITTTSFINEYHFGDFKGNPLKLMEKYFDAFLYLSNWGTFQFMLRLPKQCLDVELAKRYFPGRLTRLHEKNDYLILDYFIESEDCEDFFEESDNHLALLIPLRDNIIRGDYRSLYLAWLLTIQNETVSPSALEPPVPPNLSKLSPPLSHLIQFFKIDPYLVEVAAENSLPMDPLDTNSMDLTAWIATLPESEKSELLLCLIQDNTPHLRATLLQRCQQYLKKDHSRQIQQKPRTVIEIRELAEKKHAEATQKISATKKLSKSSR